MATTNLTADQLAFLAAARTATLATIAPDGSPRLVPVCFVVRDGTDLYVPLDEKPKRTDDPRELARVRDILERPSVALLVDRWSEDWSELGWLRIRGDASLVEPADDPADARRRRRRAPREVPAIRLASPRGTAAHQDPGHRVVELGQPRRQRLR